MNERLFLNKDLLFVLFENKWLVSDLENDPVYKNWSVSARKL